MAGNGYRKADTREQPSVGNRPRDDSRTVMASVAHLLQYGDDLMPDGPRTPDAQLKKIQGMMAAFQVNPDQHDSGLHCAMDEGGAFMRYTFLERIRRVFTIETPFKDGSKETFLAGRTRSIYFLVYKTAPETLYDKDPRFMEIDFKLKDRVTTPDGKVRYVSLVRNSKHLDRLLAIAASSAPKTMADTVSPLAGGTTEEVKAKLKKAALASCEDETFGAPQWPGFVDSMNFIIQTQDERGVPFHYINSGEKDLEFALFVNPPKGHEAPKGFVHIASLMYNRERCELYIGVE
ncbi:MAG: hypothetical protein V1827_02090 [Candidatus Micrarchaeota archaeon]